MGGVVYQQSKRELPEIYTRLTKAPVTISRVKYYFASLQEEQKVMGWSWRKSVECQVRVPAKSDSHLIYCYRPPSFLIHLASEQRGHLENLMEFTGPAL